MENTLKDIESVFIFQTHFRLPGIHLAIWRFTQRPWFPCGSPSGGGYAGELSRRGSGLSLDLHAGKAAICFLPFVNVTWFLLSLDISIQVHLISQMLYVYLYLLAIYLYRIPIHLGSFR